MSRFAAVEKTERWYLPGGCQCPGAPHEEGDWILIRVELGADDVSVIADLSNVDTLSFLARGWNLLDDDGKPAELDRANVGRLFADLYDDFETWTGGRPEVPERRDAKGKVVQARVPAIEGHVRLVTAPNGFGGRSGIGTPATAPRNRAERRQRRSSTP
jgi:hypothetical protein